MKKLFQVVIGGVAIWGACGAAMADASVAKDNPPHKALAKSVERWRDWHFGMFIHWGPVSLTEQEISWSRANSNPNYPNNGATPVAVYDELYKKFDPNKFNATEWVATAKAAGMKYMVLTVKHCDGFLLWDSKVSADGKSWREVQHVNNGGGGTQVILFDPVETRWVRMRGIQRATEWGYSIWEMRVFP